MPIDANEVLAAINAASIGIEALLKLIANLKAQAGLTDEQLSDAFKIHGQATQDAINGYLAALPK